MIPTILFVRKLLIMYNHKYIRVCSVLLITLFKRGKFKKKCLQINSYYRSPM